MSRRTKIIISILVVIILFIIGAWVVARKKAIKNNEVPPTFRAFLGLTSPKRSQVEKPPTEEGSSSFTDESSNSGEINNENTNTSNGTRTSIFTNGGFNPLGTGSPQEGAGQTSSGSSSSSSGGNTGGGPVVISPPQVATPPECSDADLNIEFTQDEIARLNALKTRFFDLAQNLNTDSDLDTEISNYDLFKSKSDKLTELNNYCNNSPVYTQAQATPVVASQPYGSVIPGNNGAINYRVPTPFWHDLTKDNQAFVHQGINWKGIFSDPDLIFPERSIEHALRINLW